MKNLFSDDHYKSPLFIGSMFVGLGIGFVWEEIPGGVILGLGVGYILSCFFNNPEDE
tara:strand:- start:283 stop:453 length:171 start_codon:yes stop_codon:yes gene_type:complete